MNGISMGYLETRIEPLDPAQAARSSAARAAMDHSHKPLWRPPLHGHAAGMAQVYDDIYGGRPVIDRRGFRGLLEFQRLTGRAPLVTEMP